jgi:ATP-dependent helicase/nuclease subunit A
MSNDVVLVQGIIDAYFFEGGKAVLVDYKTDHKSPEQLVGLYHAQLEYYAKTIESLLDRKVEERLIYSFYNDCVVEI